MCFNHPIKSFQNDFQPFVLARSARVLRCVHQPGENGLDESLVSFVGWLIFCGSVHLAIPVAAEVVWAEVRPVVWFHFGLSARQPTTVGRVLSN